LSPTAGHVPTWSSAVRHSRSKLRACDLHALGTPPAFVLSQDQTLHSVVWTGLLTLPHHGPKRTNVACASSRFSCEGTAATVVAQQVRRTKNQGTALRKGATGTWRRLWREASAFRRRKDAERASCWVYRRAVRRRHVTKREYTTRMNGCQMVAATGCEGGAERR
jgi:hypothetical protein